MSRNMTMLTDLYQLTMMYGYHKNGMSDQRAVFDLFFRRSGWETRHAIFAGLQQVIELIENLHFSTEDIEYLREKNLFDEEFLAYLADFRFNGEIYAMPEGTVVFPYEPLLRVKANICEAQLIETAMLNILNHQTLIATKASRVCKAARKGAVMEFGLRRAQGPDAGIYGARAAVIGGCSSTSNVLAGQMFDIKISGTHAHSWVMSFPTELDAFRAYAKTYPDDCLLLVDTYDTLKSGVPNAITVFNELKAAGHKPRGIRLDSGDLAYLSKEARKMLDEAGFPETIICASSDLDENLIKDLLDQDAKIDLWGVGTKMITCEDYPALGGVYKLAAREDADGNMIPKIKLSDNLYKITNPGYKKVVRIYSKKHGRALADLIMLDHETINEDEPLRITHQTERWKTKVLTNFTVRELLVPVFIDGKCVYESPSVMEIREYAKKEQETFWEEYTRFRNPHIYKVNLSDELYELKHKMMEELRQGSDYFD
ncbi:MAG: nicotinate phosphoribosyltransferase [Christensenellaceae bacterium]|nr:nicotinate phosphoribosyltransferase [Christensenellaceae bacterium]